MSKAAFDQLLADIHLHKSAHILFNEHCLVPSGARQQQKRLKKGAVPSVALGKPSATTTSAKRRQARFKKKEDEEWLDSLVSQRLQGLDAALDLQVG